MMERRKTRRCRQCMRQYLVPSQYPGCCSAECKNKRKIAPRLKPEQKEKSSDFLKSPAWEKLRYLTIKKHGNRCMACGAVGVVHVDHIKPRKMYPSLSLEPSNLQVLCGPCNRGKGAWDETDWRLNHLQS